MEDNKDKIEQVSYQTNDREIVEISQAKEVVGEAIEKKEEPAVKPSKLKEWGEKSVNRKVLAISLAIAVLVNAVLTSAIAGAFLKKQTKGMSGGRPGHEMQYGGPGGKSGKMSPDNDQRGAAPSEGNQSNEQNASKASIGIVITENDGVYIAQVNGDNAKKAGFKEGDKVVKVGDKNVSTSSDLTSEVQSHKAGDTVSVTVERDGQAIEIKTELE